MKNLLYFLHINKNAGTTMRSILKKNYPVEFFLDSMLQGRKSVNGDAKNADGLDEDVQSLISEVQNRQHTLQCVASNLPFGLHKYMDRPVTYVTFLREPVSRCISYWYFAYQTRDSGRLWSVLESYDFKLDRIFEDRAAYQFTNDQVRMLSGSSSPEPGEKELQLACDTIEKDFFLAGSVACFDSCLKILGLEFGWQNTSYVKLNVGAKTDLSLLPDGAVERFRDANQLDLRLYEWLMRNYLPRRLSVGKMTA